jgi:hypothetical protein
MRGQLRSQVPYALRTHRIVSFAPMPYAFVRSYGGCRAETNLWWLVNDRNNNAKDSFYRFARTNDMVFSFDKRETFSGTTYLSVHADDPKHLSPQKKALNEQDDLFYRPSNGSPPDWSPPSSPCNNRNRTRLKTFGNPPKPPSRKPKKNSERTGRATS